MEARISRAALLAAILFCSMGAQLRSANFIIDTPDATLARKLSTAAEKYRHDLAIEWLGKPMPNWSRPCPITVRTGKNLGAGGATTFVFDRGEVHGWRMSIQGSVDRVFDSVLPHEITHMIYASHFRQPLPRWADEGGATSVEHSSERAKHRKMLDRFLRSGRGISFSRMFAMTEYPADVMPLYAQGFSLSEYLIQCGGRKKYVVFMGGALNNGDWSGAIRRNYGFANLGKLQNTWLAWVKQGSPPLKPRVPQPGPTRPAEEMLASNAPAPRASGPTARRPRPEPNLIYREPAARLGSYAPAGVVPAAPLVAVNPPSEAKLLPSSGWHAAGSPASRAVAEIRPRSDPFRSQVSRPQPIETPRQIILEWNGR
ncbi:MAG: hypothetical protein V3V75_07470 [Thermoguttaceae bacterium]